MLPYFDNTEWSLLPRVLQLGFLTLTEESLDSELLHITARLIVSMHSLWVGCTPRLYVGVNLSPQLSLTDHLDRSVELQIMHDRVVWYLDGVANDIEYLYSE